jgi:hypothetical protein
MYSTSHLLLISLKLFVTKAELQQYSRLVGNRKFGVVVLFNAFVSVEALRLMHVELSLAWALAALHGMEGCTRIELSVSSF